ncbi:MAG: hypothetical protein BWK76_15170 [Desulfobulbaceae bacterium A2]|nr:MAG: hypothetical protein BWK76_15170 [Desulfobulbaceae bacterium A2]
MDECSVLTDLRAGGLPLEEQLLSELSHYRQKSQRLERLNCLHAALAGVTGLATMIDALSLWLSNHVVHDLLAFQHEHNGRKHYCCSAHGPQRRLLLSAAARGLHRHWEGQRVTWREDGYCASGWRFGLGGGWGRLVLLRPEGWAEDFEPEVLNEAAPVIAESLQRALEYEELLHQSRRDALTGLENRRAFEERIDSLVEQARRHQHPLTLVAMDLDHFKKVNDLLGHAAGDEALRQVATVLKRQVRGCDLLARTGGDEFLLVLMETDLLAAQHLASRILRAVASLNICAGSVHLGLSIGLCQWSPGLSRAAWLERADEILYQAKAAGRGCALAETRSWTPEGSSQETTVPRQKVAERNQHVVRQGLNTPRHRMAACAGL